MKLSSQSALRIVTEIGEIVGQNINMMDDEGVIIASTNPARIGNFHVGAKQIIDEKLTELYIKPEQSTEAVRPGLNLPITHQGSIIGVIGITGLYDEVIGYGQVVKKMTEILVREATEQEDKKLDMRVRSRFLEDWVLVETYLRGQAQALAERGIALGIDIALPRRVMVVSIQDLSRYTDTAAGQKMIEDIEMAVSNIVEKEQGNIILRNAARQILLLNKRPNNQMVQLAERLCETVLQKFDVQLAVGFDGVSANIHKAYLQANKAWRSARAAADGVRSYDQITLELFAGDIPRQTKEEYVRKVFAGCGVVEMGHWMNILQAYFQAEGSISTAANMLYMHKNTLQYRLKKLEEITGYDVRLPSNAAIFQMAMLFYREVESSLLLLDT